MTTIRKFDENMPEDEMNLTEVPASQPKVYLPYITDVTESIEKYAETRLNETPELKAQCLKEIRECLQSETGLNYRDEDKALLNFLRSRKFDVRRSASTVKKYYSFLRDHKDTFFRVNPEAVERFVSGNIVGFLPYRDARNRAIIFARAEAWNPDNFPVDDVMFGGIVALKSALEVTVNQIMGFVIIIDLKGLSLKQILSLAPKYAVFLTRGLQYCCPCLVSGIHFVNVPEVFRVLWSILKPVLSEKLKKRIKFHKTGGFGSLHELFPKEILPEELGGHLGPLDNSHWAKDIDKLQADYYEEIKYGYTTSAEKSNEGSKDSRQCWFSSMGMGRS